MGVSGITPHLTRACRAATRLSEAHKSQMLDAILGRSYATRRVQIALARELFRLGVGANGTTILGVASGLGAGFVFARGFTIVGILLLGASALFDAVDGTIAREFAVPTLFGR